MAGIRKNSFFSRPFASPESSKTRLEELEQYMGRQSKELYVSLISIDKRLTALEEKLSTQTQEDNSGA